MTLVGLALQPCTLIPSTHSLARSLARSRFSQTPPPHSPLAVVQYAESQYGAYGSRQSMNPSHITTPTAAW